MTYSIVARDPSTGELGVAVQTCMFAVGTIVPWARAGVGAVATQSVAEKAYGPRCLEAMAAGADAAAALATARAADPMSMLRQVGVVAASGSVAAFTGELCCDYAGQHTGDGYAVQANMMASADVWPAMASAYEAASGALAHRLLAALHAGESAGGDARGRMSAALVVVGRERSDDASAGVVVDLRVDDHGAPLDELARLLDRADAFHQYGAAVDALFRGDAAQALELVDGALRHDPDEGNFVFVRVGALALAGRTAEAADTMRTLLALNPGWRVVARSFGAKGLLPIPDDPELARLLD